MDDRKRRSRFSGHVICILFAALFTAAAFINTRHIQQEKLQSFYYYDYRMPEDYTTVFDASIRKKKDTGSIRQGDKISERMMFLKFPGGKKQHFRSVIVILKDSFPFDSECNLYYQNRSGRLDSKCKLLVALPRGEKIVYFPMPKAADYEMSEIRVDFEDKYKLDKVLVSGDDLTTIYNPEEASPKRFTAICFLALLFISECVHFFSSEIWSFLKQLLKKRKKVAAFLLSAGLVAINCVLAADIIFEVAGNKGSSSRLIFLTGTAEIIAWEIYLLIKRPHGTQGGEQSLANGNRSEKKDFFTKGLFWILIAVILCRVILAFSDSIEEMSEVMDRAHVLIPLAVITVQILLLALLYRRYILLKEEKDISFRKAYLFLFLILGLAYLFLFLPYVSPDEADHYLSAYRVSDILLGQIGQLGDKRLFMRREDYLFFKQQKFVLEPEYYMEITKSIRLHLQEPGYVIAGGPMVTNSIFSYIPAGAGIAIARILHLSGALTFYFGRIGNLLFFAAILWYMMNKISWGAAAFFAIAMFPMTLHIAGSFSYDAATFCLVALFVVQVIQMIWKDGKVSTGEIVRCIFFGCLMAPSKMVYIPLLLLVFLIPSEKLAENASKAMRMKCAVVFFSMASMIVVMSAISLLGAESAIREMVQDNAVVNMVAWAHEEGYTVSWVIHHPLKYLVMCFRTLFVMADHYFLTMVGSKLGWLNIGVPQLPVIVSFFAYLLAVNIRDDESRAIQADRKTRGIIAVLCAGSVMMTMLVMALNWTPVSYTYITGVQGRYFLPLLVPAVLLFRSPLLQVDGSVKKYLLFFGGAANILILVYVFTHTMV